jgi:hypothetical protein
VSVALGVAGAAAAVWAASRVYGYIEGVRVWSDLADEFRLRRARIEDLDREWALNPDRSQAIVSLTTIPSRVHLIGETLKSLMRQTRAPARIVINVPHTSRREGCGYEIPEVLTRLQAVEIHRCDDWGPATKLIPSVLRLTPSQPIVVVDDDRIYPPNLVADLDAAAAVHRNRALCFSGWRVPDDLTDRPTTLWRDLMSQPPVPVKATRIRSALEVDVLQGMSGYLVRPGFFDAARLTDYSGAPEAAFFVDDVWISGHCRARKYVIPAARFNYEPRRHARYFKSNSVALINRGDGTPESRNNTIVIRHLKDAWLCTR